MIRHHRSGRRLPARLAALLALPLLLLTAPLAGAQTGGPAAPTSAARPAADLADCIQLGLQQHPRVVAQRASLAAAEDGARALEAFRFAGLVVPELPVRRRQAGLGVAAAAAGLDQAERDTVYAITRTYFTVVFAREQERVANGVVQRLSAVHDTAKRQLDAGARDITDVDVNKALVYLRLAESKRIQAAQGVKRALQALREATGVGPCVPFDVLIGRLAESGARPVREDVLAAALSRRGELTRAGIFVEVTCLEAEAQGAACHKRMETFAAGSDIHAVQVPQEVRNNEYRPGGVPPEMPTLLAGAKADRVKRAQSFHTRALAVVESTRNLIGLEAGDAYLRWEEAALQLPGLKEAAEVAEKTAGQLNKDFAVGAKVRVDDVVNAHVLASQARAQYNEALYHQILALADLERITAGAFCANLPDLAGRK
jgi:outer membrane protein TolC